MAYAGYRTYKTHSDGPRHDPVNNGKKRVCELCGKGFNPLQRIDTMRNGTKSMTVHRKCKLRALEVKMPKE